MEQHVVSNHFVLDAFNFVVQACRTGVHHAAASLHLASWSALKTSLQTAQGKTKRSIEQNKPAGAEVTLEHKVVIGPEQSGASPDKADIFPGLYSPTLAAAILPTQPFLGSGTVLVNTLWHDCAAVAAIGLKSGSVTRLTPPDGCYTLLATMPHILLAERSSLVEPSAVAAALLPEKRDLSGALSWEILGPPVPSKVTDTLQNIAQTSHVVGDAHIPAVLLSPKGDQEKKKVSGAPALLFLHGGPHAAATRSWMPALARIAATGYIVIMPNYRGSSGYGEAHLQALPGHIGSVRSLTEFSALLMHLACGSVTSRAVQAIQEMHPTDKPSLCLATVTMSSYHECNSVTSESAHALQEACPEFVTVGRQDNVLCCSTLPFIRCTSCECIRNDA